MKATLYENVESSFELITEPGSFVSRINEIISHYQIRYNNLPPVQFDLIKNQIINYLRDKDLLSEFIFMEMWRRERAEIKIIALHLLSIFIQNPGRREIQYLNMVLRQATRKVEMQIIYKSLFVIVQRNFRAWFPYLQIILNSENIEIKRYGILLLGWLAAKNKKMIPHFRLILTDLTEIENAEIKILVRQTLNGMIDSPEQTEPESLEKIIIHK